VTNSELHFDWMKFEYLTQLVKPESGSLETRRTQIHILRLEYLICSSLVLCCLLSSFLGFPGGGVSPEDVLKGYFLVI